MHDDAMSGEQEGGRDEGVAAPAAEPNQLTDQPARSDEQALIMAPLVGLAFALLAGFAVWATLELILPVFQLPDHLQELGGNAPAEEHQLLRDTIKVNKDKNAVVALVLLAATLALVLAGSELLHRRAGPRVVWGGVLAGLIAAVIALGAGTLAIGVHDALDLQGNRLGKTIIVQGAMLGFTGLGIGLAVAAPLFRPRLLLTCVAGCVIGGVLAALIFPIAASTCLPNLNTDHLVPPSGVGRLLWIGLATGLMGIAVTGLGKEKKKKMRAAAPSTTGTA